MLIYQLHPLQFFMLFNNINVRFFSLGFMIIIMMRCVVGPAIYYFFLFSLSFYSWKTTYFLKTYFIHSFIHDGTPRIRWIGCIVIFIVHQVCNIPQGYFPQHNTIKSLCNAKNAKLDRPCILYTPQHCFESFRAFPSLFTFTTTSTSKRTTQAEDKSKCRKVFRRNHASFLLSSVTLGKKRNVCGILQIKIKYFENSKIKVTFYK